MYGLKQARYNWYSTFIDELLKVRFKQNAVEKCLFIRNNCIIIVYVDDCLLFSQSHSVLDEMIILQYLLQNNIEQLHRDISWLGGHSQCQWIINLRQPGLINKVIKLCGLEAESNKHLTPADKILQESNGCDEPRQHQWS
jgi:hypothetical protein